MDKTLAPGFFRTTYTGVGGIHHALVPVNLDPASVAGLEPDLIPKSGTPVGAVAAISSYINAWGGLLANTQNIGLVEIYKVNASTGEGTFLYGFDYGGAGAGSAPAIPLAMLTFTFKLVNGKVFRATVMEGIIAVNEKVFPPYSSPSAPHTFQEYVCGDDSVVYGRGNSYPFAPISITTKTSDSLRTREGL